MSRLLSQLHEFETPFALVELEKVRQNLERVMSYARIHGLRVRPHTKTHKDLTIGQLQIAKGAAGLTVATAREAEVMSQVTRDLLVAYPPVDPARIERLMKLPRDVELLLALDSRAAIERAVAAAREHRRFIRLLLELDLGNRRTGLRKTDELLSLAEACDGRYSAFAGVLYYPGHLRRLAVDPAQLTTCKLAAEPSPLSAAEQAGAPSSEDATLPSELSRPPLTSASLPPPPGLELVQAELSLQLEALQGHGFAPGIVSGGSSPSLFQSHLLTGTTEIRPGTFIYSDRDLAAQAVFPLSACAYVVIATVVSTAVPGQIVVDAGSKALGREPIAGLRGFGALLDAPELCVDQLSEEHGIIQLGDTSRRYELGDRLAIVPNHVCVSVNLQDRIAYWDGSDLVWREPAGRGRGPLLRS